MPHDKLGNELQAGDRIYVPALVTSVGETEEGCNCNWKIEANPEAGQQYEAMGTCNSKLVEKALEPDDEELGAPLGG